MNSAIADGTGNLTSPEPFPLRLPSRISNGTSQLQSLFMNFAVADCRRNFMSPTPFPLRPRLRFPTHPFKFNRCFMNSVIADCTMNLTFPALCLSRHPSRMFHEDAKRQCMFREFRRRGLHKEPDFSGAFHLRVPAQI